MPLFPKFNKKAEKSLYPWSQRKVTGSSQALPRYGHGAALIDPDHIAIIGGVCKSQLKKQVIVMGTNHSSATALGTAGDGPSPRCFSTLVSIEGFLLLYGGEPLIPNEVWDPHFYVLHKNTRQWSRVRTKGQLPVERAGHSSCVANGMIYVWGGQSHGQYLDDLCIFNVKDYPAKPEWEFPKCSNKGPSARSGHVSVIYENTLYIFGGLNNTHLYNDIWALDLKTYEWTQVGAVGYIPAPRESSAAALVGDIIYIFGGRGVNGCGLGDLCAFRIKTKRWYMFQNMGSPPSPRYGHSLSVSGSKVYVVGGESVTGKTEDTAYVYILDCNKITYPQEPTENRNSSNSNESVSGDENATVKIPQSPRPARQSSMLSNSRSPQPEQSPIPPSSLLQVVQSNQRQVQQQDITQPPVRPPRNGATLSTDILYGESSQLDAEEKKALMREIVEKKLTIVEMKKKEQWWKTEVSLARHLFPSIQHSSQDDPPLIDFSNESHDGDRFEMYRKLVQIKTELRKTRDSITRQTEPIVEKMEQAEAIRVAALEEASFYKARYMALKSRDAEKLKELDDERSVKLEKRLVDAYAEHGARTRTLQQLQKQLQQDQSARLMAEQRAKNAQILAESAQEAHQHVLEELAHLHAHILRAEDQGRRDALEIANLSSQLAQQLSMQENDFSKTNIEIARIEASNMKYRNETASLQNQLEESKHQEMLLKQIMNEKEEAYLDAVSELEQTNIQLELMKQSSKKHLAKLVGEE